MSDMTFSQPVLTAERLRLRPLVRSDAALIALYASDARVATMTETIPHPYPPGQAEAFLERLALPSTSEIVWAMDSGEDSENGLVGVISLKPRVGSEAEIGYWVAPAFWGTGFGAEAVAAVVDYAAGQGYPALVAQVFQDNVPSAKVLSRAGFTFTGPGEAHSVARRAMVPTFCYRRDLAGSGGPSA